jgi:hypothetical protein
VPVVPIVVVVVVLPGVGTEPITESDCSGKSAVV